MNVVITSYEVGLRLFLLCMSIIIVIIILLTKVGDIIFTFTNYLMSLIQYLTRVLDNGTIIIRYNFTSYHTFWC